MVTTAETDAARHRLLLTGCIALIGAGLLLRVPVSVGALTIFLLLWQALAARYAWPMPGFWLRAALAVACFALVWALVGHVLGRRAGASLLLLMVALKLCELRSHRDVMLVLSLACFVLVSQFLFSQAPWMVAYLAAGLAVIVTGFVYANQNPSAPSLRAATIEGGRLMVLALPLMAVLFVLFPRIPGSLWGSPAAGGAARTGLSDRMQPGTISALARSDGVALRARFPDGEVPSPDQRYWRGPVLWHFADGAWTTGRQHPAAGKHDKPVTQTKRVDISLAPTQRHWLIALDRPVAVDRDATLTRGDTFYADARVHKRIEYSQRWAPPGSIAAEPLSSIVRRRATQLPANGNPSARALAKRWAGQASDPRGIIDKALALFHERRFFYTLEPPRTGTRNSIDAFLFNTRRGFCGHYAGALTFLMRAAGLPARVVTGYLGATRSSVGDYWIVRNADAHAWSEVWIAGRGWVRVDPTAAVAPQRIEGGIGAAVTDTDALPFMARAGGGLWYRAGLVWDAFNVGWDRYVLGYGPGAQKRILATIGLDTLRAALIALTLALTLILGAVSLLLAWQMRTRRETDPVKRAWRRVERRLTRAGVAPRTGEGPRAYAERAARQRPELRDRVHELAELYIRIRYANADPTGTARREFARQARAFRARRASYTR